MRRTITWVLALASIILATVLACAALERVLPPPESAMRAQFERWQQATEAGDWAAVWALLGPPSPMTSEAKPGSVPDKDAFVRQLQAHHPDLQRRVQELQLFRRMTHVDDYATFMVVVELGYYPSNAQQPRHIAELRFYMTRQDGRIGLWGFQPAVW